ncbi:MAG: PHP domain-containing protein [Bacillota bacterium]|nr:PHP domain-containing protein [Bacillota bacterium]
MKLFYDFHIHSCLSLCAEDDMTPCNIANMAALAGLSAIAVSDHQSALNCPAVAEACKRAGITAVPAMELCTREEVHVLCLFSTQEGALLCSDFVRSRLILPRSTARIKIRQTVMDAFDNEISDEKAYLGAAADIGIYDVCGLVDSFGGIAVPAHIDRPSYSLLANLAFFDPAMGFGTFEVSKDCDSIRLLTEHQELRGKRFLRNSDAHSLGDISDPVNFIEAADLSVRSILSALKQEPLF